MRAFTQARPFARLAILASITWLGCKGRDAEVPALSPDVHLSTWRLQDPPALVIGSDTGWSAAFGRVAGALRLSNGSIVVADVQPAELRLFDSTGRYVRTVGPTGSGPGEFRFPGRPRPFAGDSFYVVDIEQRRVSFFDGDAKPVVTRRFTLQVGDEVFFPIGVVSSEQFIATLTPNRIPSRLGERIRNPVQVVTGRFAAPGFDGIARGRGIEFIGGVWHEAGRTAVMAYPLEFGNTTQVAVGSGLIYVGDTEKPRIEVFDLSGRSIGALEWDAPRDAITEADRQARIAQESTQIAGIPQGPDPQQLWSEVEHLRTTELSKHAPTFKSLLPVSDGSLWVEQDPRPWTEGRQFLVFDSTRTLVARLTIPRQLTPYQVDGDLILGRWRESGEADQVRVYRLVR